MSLVIEKAGALSLLQDQGRFGYQAIGVTTGGPMDSHAFSWANKLLDNQRNASQIEITMGPFKAYFLKATTFALCGADVDVRLNGRAIVPWQSWRAVAGDRLELGYPRKGLRSYLAVRGGFTVAMTLGSCATVIRDRLGGCDGDGNRLICGDELDFASDTQLIQRSVPPMYIPNYGSVIKLGVLPTYQFDTFSDEARNRFFGEVYTVTSQMDRMGTRLAGQPVMTPSQDFISEGIALGAIQIPADGQPIILMRDRQTIGGYPKMGCVCQQDLNQLAQARPGTQINFYLKNMDQASAQLQYQQAFFIE